MTGRHGVDRQALLEQWIRGERLEGGERSASREGASAPLSSAQARLFYLERLQPGAVYNEPLAIRLEGALDREALTAALREIVRRHAVMRTTFGFEGGEPVQRVGAQAEIDLPLEDLSTRPLDRALATLPPGEVEDRLDRRRLEEELRRRMVEEARRPFDLERGPVFRARLFRLGERDHTLLLMMHHIACDGWSLGIMSGELAALYRAHRLREPALLPPLPFQYADYAREQRRWMEGDECQAQLEHWTRRLEGVGTLELPTSRPRPPAPRLDGATLAFRMPRRLADGLNTLSRQHGTTLFTTLLAAFQLLLHRYSGQTDFAVGVPVAGRDRLELEPLIGFFVNMLPLRADLSGNPTFSTLLARVKEVTLEAFAHPALPFERLVEALRVERDPGRHPLFQVMFGLHNPPAPPLELPGLRATPSVVDRGATKFDLALYLVESGSGLEGTLEYRTDLFDAAMIERLAGHYQVLLEGIAVDPDRRISRIPMLPEAERHRLAAWNRTEAPFSEDACIHTLVEARAALHPERVAVEFEGERLSYGELEARATALAVRLRALGVGPEVPVGLCVDRGLEMVVGMLGVLKAGGAYVPLDPAYPKARLQAMLEVARPPVVLTVARLAERLPETPGRVVWLDRLPEASPVERGEMKTGGPHSLAYIIFTSGTTGTPKAVMLTHRGLCNLIEAQLDAFDIHEESRVLQVASFCFDASVSEVFTALVAGATLCFGRRDAPLAGPGLQRLLRDEAISVVTLTPSVLASLDPGQPLPTLRTLVSAGEACPGELVARWAPGRRFVNAYGPTETTIGAAWALCNDGSSSPPIGRPFQNVTLYVLDEALEPVPIGVPGELYVGGVGVARGFLGQPALTAERFIPDPFGDRPGDRLYRTGDRVRFREDGQIEYLGRLDHQVKLRGLRIEPGEIEQTLCRHPAVQTALVLVREDTPGDRRLVAYVVPRQGATTDAPNTRAGTPPDELELRVFLEQRLARYMVPSAFVLLDRLPVTPNGKLDPAALPKPALEAKRAYVAPRDGLEQQLSALWEELLGVRPVGVTDDFFALGGHSMLALQLMARIQARLGREVPLSVLLEQATIEHLARWMRAGGEAAGEAGPALVCLQPTGEGTPFYCVHPIGGHVLCYQGLARQLGTERPFYALPAPGVDGAGEPCDSLEALAAHHVETILRHRPAGPILLGGWSMGGLVALEMAGRLVHRGIQVALVTLIDPHLPGSVDLDPGLDDATLLEIWLQDLALQQGRELPPDEPGTEQLAPEARLTRVIETATTAGLFPAGVSRRSIERRLAVFRAHLQAMREAVVKPVNVPVTLIRAVDPLAWQSIEEDEVWRSLCRGGLTLDPIPGDHYSLLGPQVAPLAGRMRTRFDEALASAGARKGERA